MPQTNSSRRRQISDDYWKKRYKEAGVVPSPTGGVQVTNPTNRLGYDFASQSDAANWRQQNYVPIVQAIQNRDPRIVNSTTLDVARYGLQNGLLNQEQYNYIAGNVTSFRKTLETTPLTNDDGPIQYGRLGRTGDGSFGPVQSTLTHSKLIQYNPDGSWGYQFPSSAQDINNVTENTRLRQLGLIRDAQPVSVGLETVSNLGSFGLGAGIGVLGGMTPGGGIPQDYLAGRFGNTPAFAPDSFAGRALSTAEGTRVGIGTKPLDYMSGITQGTSYLSARMGGNTPDQANEIAANITQQSPWYQASNEANAPGVDNPYFQIGSAFGGELAQAIPAMYSSLGLLNASASLGGRLLAPFGAQASGVGRAIGLTAGVVTPPLVQGFRDQLTGGQPGIREDIVAGYEAITDPIRSTAQRGMSENALIAQQTYDPEGKVAGAFQQAGMLAMASGGAVQMWKDVKSEASRGINTFRGRLKETNNPFKALSSGIAATVENEVGRAAMTDLGFASTQPLSDIGRKIYASTRIDKSKPFDEPTGADIVKSLLLGLVASRPGKNAQWIFRGNPLQSMEPKTMAIAHATDIVRKGPAELQAIRDYFIKEKGFSPKEVQNADDLIRKVATVFMNEHEITRSMLNKGTLPDGWPVFKSVKDLVETFFRSPEMFPDYVREVINVALEAPGELTDIDPAYDNSPVVQRRAIRALTEQLIPEYTKLLEQNKPQAQEVKPESKYWGIDLGDGNMLVYSPDFSSAVMRPLGESPDITMLRATRSATEPTVVNTPERYDAYVAASRLRGRTFSVDGRDAVVIGFSKDGLRIKYDSGVEQDLSRDQLVGLRQALEAAGENDQVDIVSDMIDSLEVIQRDGSLSTPHDGARGSDKRFDIELGPELRGNKVGEARDVAFIQGDDGRYYMADKQSGVPTKGDIYDSDQYVRNSADISRSAGPYRITLTNVDGSISPIDIALSADQIAAIIEDGAGNPQEIMQNALDNVESNTLQRGDVVSIPYKNTRRRYVVIDSQSDYAVGIPIDNIGDVPAYIFQSPENRIESINREFLRKQMEDAQRTIGVEVTDLRPSPDLLSNISQYAFWLARQDSGDGHTVTVIPEIVNATAEELPQLIYDTIMRNLERKGVESDVIASIREWMLKNPETAIQMESAIHRATVLEMSKPASERSIDALVKFQKIADSEEINNVLDEIVKRYDTEAPISTDVNFSSSPRRIGRAQGQLQTLINAADILSRHLRRTGNITDEQATRILRNFLGGNPLFADNLDNAIATTKRLAKLKSAVNPLALGVVLQKGSIWMLEKMAALPHDIQILSALLPYEDMPDTYRDGFGEWFKTKEKFDNAVKYARDLYSRALANGPEALDNFRQAMYDNRLGFFYEIAKGGDAIVRPLSVDITDPRANDVLRANLQRSSDSVGEMIKRAATEKVVLLTDQLNRNRELPDSAIPVPLSEITTAIQAAAPDGVLHLGSVTDSQAQLVLANDAPGVQALVDLGRGLIDQVDNSDVFTGITIYQASEAQNINAQDLQLAAKAQEAEQFLEKSREVFGALPEETKSALLALASPLMWLVDTIRAVDRSDSNAAREALIAGMINAQGGDGQTVLGFKLSDMFESDEDAQRFQQYATEVLAKVAQTERTGESVETKRTTAIRGAMKELVKLADFIAGPDGKELVQDPETGKYTSETESILKQVAELYLRKGINVLDLRTFIELSSKEVIRGLLRNTTRSQSADALNIVNTITSHASLSEQMARAANNIIGSEADKAAALRLVHSASTDGLRYLGVSFDPQRRLQISEAVSTIQRRYKEEGALLSPTQRAQMLLDMAKELSTDIADFILGDKSLEEDTGAAYTPAMEVGATQLVNELSSGATFVKKATGAKDAAQLLMAGNRAGLEKILLATLLDAASKDEVTYESIDRVMTEAVIGPEKTRKYYDRKRNERYVNDSLLFNKNPRMLAAVVPGLDTTYSLNGEDTSGLVEGQAVFNLYYDKMMSMLSNSNKQKFIDALHNYAKSKRGESGDQVFTFDVKDLLTIAEGFEETRNGLFKLTSDASTFSIGMTGKDSQAIVYKVKSLLAAIKAFDTDAVAINRTTYVADQIKSSRPYRSQVEQFESVSIFEALNEDVVTKNDAKYLSAYYGQLAKDTTYSDRERASFTDLAKHYRAIDRKSSDAPVAVANRYSDAISVSRNLAKLYDMYAARQATNLITADIDGNFNLEDYKALTAFLGLDQSIMQLVINARSIKDILNDNVLTKDQQKMLVSLRAAQLKQDFYNQHHQLFFAHESMMSEIGYSMMVDVNKNVDAFIKPIVVQTTDNSKRSIASLLFMAASKNMDKSALTLAHEVSHHLFRALPDSAQLKWIRAITPPLLSKGDGEHISPEMRLFHDYLNEMNSSFNELSDANKPLFRLMDIRDFANGLQGESYTPEQIANAKTIFAEMSATSMVNFILNSSVVHEPGGTVPVAEDVTATIATLRSVLLPMASRLASEYGPYASINSKPTNAFYYRPSPVVYQTTSKSGVNRKFYPMRHGSFVSFVNDVGKKYTGAMRTVDIHDLLVNNKSLFGNRSRLDALLTTLIADGNVRQTLVDKLNSLHSRGFEYGKHYRLNVFGDNGFLSQTPDTADEQGWSAIGRVVGMVREKASDAGWGGTTIDLMGKRWVLDKKIDRDRSPWYGLNLIDTSSLVARLFQRGTKGDYGYIVESNSGLRLRLLFEGKDMDLGADNFTARDVKLNYIVGHDYMDQSPNFHMVGTSDINNSSFTSLIYSMLGRIDRAIVDIGGQRTYEYELRMNAALADGMRTGSFDKWNEVISAPLAIAMNKDIASIIASTPKNELLAVQNTGVHGWLRNQIHARNLNRWARNIPDENVRQQVMGYINDITQQHADTVGKGLSDDSATSITDKLLNFMSEGLGWYSFVPIVSEKFADRGVAPMIVAMHEQMFSSLKDVTDFLEHVYAARQAAFSDPSATSIKQYLANPTEALGVNSRGEAFLPKSLTVKLGETTLDASSLIEQLFGIDLSDDQIGEVFTQFMQQWGATALRRWVNENNAVLDTSSKKLTDRLRELFVLMQSEPAATTETAVAVVDPTAPAAPKAPTIYDRVGLSDNYSDRGKLVNVAGVLDFLSSQVDTADNFVNIVNYYVGQSDVSKTFNPQTALKVVPHAVLDHILTKVFTSDQQRVNFLQAASGIVPANGTARDVISARNLFNVVEHIVRTDAKIRNAALRNWKSYELVSTDVDTGDVIIRSPDRDIAADTKGESKSGALYRVNMENGNVTLVAKSRRLNKQTGKYEDSYVDVKDVNDYLRYNWVNKPNETAKKDPLAFDAANKSIVLSSEQLFGPDVNKFFNTLTGLVGSETLVHSMANDLPVYFLLPDTLAAYASRSETVTDTFEDAVNGTENSMTTNNGMHLVKGQYNQKTKEWEFRQAKNNWQSADNYRSQLPIGLLQMVVNSFENSSAMTLTAERQQELLQHKMLHEEYHIAKLLLASDRATANPKHLAFNKVGNKSLVPSGGDFLQDASNGTWYSSSPKFVDNNGDNIPVQKDQQGVHIDDFGDSSIADSRDAYNEYARITEQAHRDKTEQMTFYKDPNTKQGILTTGTPEHPVMQVSSDAWELRVGQFLKGTEYDTDVKDGEAITVDKVDLDPVFASSPKLKESAYAANKWVFQPARVLTQFWTLALDISSLAIQLGSQVRNPVRLLKAIACALPEAIAVSTADIGLIGGHFLHASRQANRYANRGSKFWSQAWNLDTKYYNFIMNSMVDRYNQTNGLTKPITMTDLIEKYHMESAYSDWWKAHKANTIADPSKYQSIIDTPFASSRENSFADKVPALLVPAARRFDMTRQLLIDLCMVQNALSAVKDARAQKYSKNKRETWEIDRDIKTALLNYAKEMGIGGHAKSKTQAPVWNVLGKIVQYPQTAPGYNRNFMQYWGFTTQLGIGAKRKVNEIARIATAGGPKWLEGEIFDIESDERFFKYNASSSFARDRMARDKGTTLAVYTGLLLLNGALRFYQNMQDRPDEQNDDTEWWNPTSKRFGYTRLNDNWVFAVPVLNRFGQILKPLSALADPTNYGPKEKAQAFFQSAFQTYIKNKLNNGAQYIISSATGSSFDKRAAYERHQGLRVAVENDVRAPFYFHPAGYLMPEQSNLTMDTLTYSHQSQYYDDLLKLGLFSEAAKRNMTVNEMIESGDVPNRIMINKDAAKELWWKGTLGRMTGGNFIYEPRQFNAVNKEPVEMGDGSITVGRLAYMMREWYKYPNLFQTLGKEPSAVLKGYPLKSPSAYAIGFPSPESQSRGTIKANRRLPLNNQARALMDIYESEVEKKVEEDTNEQQSGQ